MVCVSAVRAGSSARVLLRLQVQAGNRQSVSSTGGQRVMRVASVGHGAGIGQIGGQAGLILQFCHSNATQWTLRIQLCVQEMVGSLVRVEMPVTT